GRRRTYLLATGGSELKLPSDLQGLTRLPFITRTDENLRAALNEAVLAIEQQVKAHGPRHEVPPSGTLPGRRALEREIELVCDNALAQGWTIKTNTETTLRLRSPHDHSHTFSKGKPDQTRGELRRFAAELRGAGLRINSSVRRPVEESPFSE
ncbi:hypothetical protein, partial [Specibacter cremeus]|uniref:hypothetical protein n=1 Tax=Specibacter cremeus TaxID=1629051 RepID=UPI00197B6A11